MATRGKTATPVKRTPRRRGENSEAILAAAHRLVAERGENFTTQDLIKEADVALQTFYRAYGGKDQLLLAVIADMIKGHCAALEAEVEGLDDPVARLRLFVENTLSALHDSRAGESGRRFITSQHWRLHQIDPEGLAEATKPFTDLVQRELEAARATGALSPRDPEHDAWLINKLVITVFHHYAFMPDDAIGDDIAEHVWQFCLAAVGGGAPAPRRRGPRSRRLSRGSPAPG